MPLPTVRATVSPRFRAFSLRTTLLRAQTIRSFRLTSTPTGGSRPGRRRDHRPINALAALIVGAAALQPGLAAADNDDPPGGRPAERPAAEVSKDLAPWEAIEGAVDRGTYRLGPGDRLAVTITGPVQRTEHVQVSAEGTLLLPPAVGVLVAGHTIDESQSIVRDALRSYYRGIEVRLDLVAVRRFEVYALGLVANIGTYVADAATRVSTVVDEAGGLLSSSSQRQIRLLHADGSEEQVDLLRFLLHGDYDANPFLLDGDRIVIPVAGEKASVRGAVGRPDDYEVVPGETVQDLIRLAGGTTPGADRTRVAVNRFSGDVESPTEGQIVDLDHPAREIPARPGDQIFVFAQPQWHVRRTVDVRGEVRFPGLYVVNEGQETLKSIIERAGGFTQNASVHSAKLTRSIGVETVDPEFERLKSIDVADMNTDEYEYFKLKSRTRPGLVVADFAALFEEGDLSEDVAIRRGDRIDVPTAVQSIDVAGQVASPGAVAFEEERPIKWYIEKAGGYGWRASKGKTRVIRAQTGEWVSAKNVKELQIGDTIWVPEKPERDYWEAFKEGLVLTGQVLTVYLVIDRIAQ